MHWLWDLMESPAVDLKSLRRRTNLLLAIHLILPLGAALAVVLIVWRAQLFVTLSQRTNVETLLIAFVLAYCGYIFLTTSPATLGALRLLAMRVRGRDRAQVSLQRKARNDRRETKRFYLNVVVRGPRKGAIVLPIEDSRGSLGTVRLDLAELAAVDVPEELTISAMQLVLKALAEVATLEGTDLKPKIVYWDGLDEEQAHIYASQVGAFDRLESALKTAPLWPVARLDDRGIERLRDVLRDATPLFRESLLLPDVEYEAEFTIPVIPEPLALMQLRRRTRHADAVASMGCVTLVTLAFLGLLTLFAISPPWVPGK